MTRQPIPTTRTRCISLLAVRHAPTVAEGLCVGNGEVPCALSAHEAASTILRSLPERRFDHVWASPAERCRQPAKLIAERLRTPLSTDDRLKEICLGAWQLRSWASIEAADSSRYRSWLENWSTKAPPGGELPDAFLRRVASWWQALPAGAHLLVSHAGVNRALRLLIHGKTWQESMTMPVPHLQAELFEQVIGST